jgi:anti-sigma regulatory factor (Ser/Thr protein kinase)
LRLQEYVAELSAISLDSEDEFYTYPDCLKLGEYRDCLAFTAVADTVNIGVLSNAVREFVEGLAYSEGICYNVDLVVSEALTNVMVHGFKGCRPAPVKLTVLAFKYVVGVVVEDYGASIPAHVLDLVRSTDVFENDLPLGELPEGGMGLSFMRMVSLRFVYRVTQDSNKLILLL